MPARIVLGVGAGIAAYKAALILRDLQRAGHDVWVVPTPASTHFVGVTTWEGLSGHPVHTDVFSTGGDDHIELARRADLIVVVPTTADLLARIRTGQADDLLTTTIIASTCPVILAPAMHTAMWCSPATRDNVATLGERGVHIVEPTDGALASGDQGVGRLADEQDILEAITRVLASDTAHTDTPAQERDLERHRVCITAGGTRELIDPVRYLGNRSSGRQGIALALQAQARGAEVTLIASNIDQALIPQGIRVIQAPSAHDVERAVFTELPQCDVLIMAAAVADFRPRQMSAQKIKKEAGTDSAPVIELERTVDILATVATHPQRPEVLVGFAAETGSLDEVLAHGRTKARAKGADLLAVNAVGVSTGFGDVPNTIHVLDAQGQTLAEGGGTKTEAAALLMDLIAQRLHSR